MIRRNGTLVLLVVLLVVAAGSVVAASATFEVGSLLGRMSLASQPHRLFATSNLGIVELDPDTGAILNTFSAPVQQGVSDGLAFDGTTLYYLSGSIEPNTLYALDPDTGSVETTYGLPESAFRDGLAYLGGMIYILDWSVLTQQLTIFDPDQGIVVGALDIDAANPDPPGIKGGLAGITAPNALLVTASSLDGDEVLEIDPANGLITHRFTHGLGSGVLGAAVVNGQIYLGSNTSPDLTIYLRDGTPQGSITIPGAIGIQSLGGDDTTLMAISKAVTPTGKVNIGDLLTYTLSILATPGSELGLYDPLEDTTFLSFLPPPVAGIVHQDGVVTGSLTVSPTSQVTVSFLVQVSEGAGPTVSNKACIYPLPGTIEWCEWSNEVVNDIQQPPGIPSLLSPPDGTVTTTQAITFTWQAGAGEAPEGYNLELDGQVFTTTDTTLSTVLSLGAHTWTVRAFNSAGTSDWASTRTLDVVPPPPGVPTLLSPADGTVTTTQTITFTWQAGAGEPPDGYNLDLDGEVVTTTSTSLSTDLSLGLHSWTVRAFNAGGSSNWASARTVERIKYRIYLPLVQRNYP